MHIGTICTINSYTHTYLCIYTNIHTCSDINICMPTHLFSYMKYKCKVLLIFLNRYTYADVQAHIHICSSTLTLTLHMYTNIYIYIYIYIYTNINTDVHEDNFINLHIYACKHTCTSTYIYTYPFICRLIHR